MSSDFSSHGDSFLCDYWNDQDGGLAWMLDLEAELERRGFETRDDDGHPRQIDDAEMFGIQRERGKR